MKYIVLSFQPPLSNLELFVIFLGLYCVIEGLYMAFLMNGGEKVCRIIKYLGVGCTGIYAMILVRHREFYAEDLIWLGTVCLFLWPNTVQRFFPIFDRRKGWELFK